MNTDTNNIRPINITMEIKPHNSKTIKKLPSFGRNLKTYFREYTENTSLHGVRYLGQYRRSRFEKIYWILVFMISLFLCTNLIVKTYNKWERSPVIISFATSPTPIWKIPFPAVTICPLMKAKQSIFNFTDLYHKIVTDNDNYTDEEQSNFAKVSLLCTETLYLDGNLTTEKDTIEFFVKLARGLDGILLNLRDDFTPILTQEGVCYTHNMLDGNDIYRDEVYNYKQYFNHEKYRRSNWSLEMGYLNTPINDSYPKRALSSGMYAGQNIFFNAREMDLDYVCTGPMQGLKIFLHDPAEIPSINTNVFIAPLGEFTAVAVKPDMMTTSENLRTYDSHSRHCFFSDERKLRFFKNYNQQNCKLECLTNYTLDMCNCVSFYMPHNESTAICGSGSRRCVIDARDQHFILEAESGISALYQSNQKDDRKGCDCLPACSSLTYNTEISQLWFPTKSVFNAFRYNISADAKYSRILVFFKEMQFITSERNQLYGVTDFLASCGGLLSLFIGFSFISVVETFYFLTFRLMCNIRKYGKHYWSGASELIRDDAYIHNK